MKRFCVQVTLQRRLTGELGEEVFRALIPYTDVSIGAGDVSTTVVSVTLPAESLEAASSWVMDRLARFSEKGQVMTSEIS
ncbi:hypothetical protein [Arsenicicoccus dermatophilus]|uniref:hypothetical protein n=1 Tax=Arsenicicoccus dermatophilus TaxID=1076331 RepID=UPI001F4C96AF|nr:hypothetical protein [Arsenicicoccus dermatophilus]MCH8613447.1 hypothetical protein [Arsenicicoccus dermatophilus]